VKLGVRTTLEEEPLRRNTGKSVWCAKGWQLILWWHSLRPLNQWSWKPLGGAP